MSYVFVEKEHSNEQVLDSSGGLVSPDFGIASLSYEDTSSLGSSNSDSGDIRRHTYTPTLVNSWIPRQDVRQDVRTMIEIPDSCVEYIGRLMTGEIVEATAIENENEPIIKVYSNNSPTKLVPRFFGSSTRRSRSRCIAHIHLCECIAVFSCCIFT
jgi:hypothetical protein